MDDFFVIPDKTKKQKVKQAFCPCGLSKTCLAPMMTIGGRGKKGILALAEAPGKNEDEQFALELAHAKRENRPPKGTQLIGAAGSRIASELKKVDIDLYNDCYLYNACNCRPPNNRTPTGIEIASCRNRVLSVINELKPKAVLLLGMCSIESLIAHRWFDDKMGGIGRWRGWSIPDSDLNTWLFPVWHPSYVLRCEISNEPQVPLYFKIDIENFASNYKKPHEGLKLSDIPIQIIYDDEKAIKIIKHILKSDEITAFDYETTSLKPYAVEHKIVSVSVCQKETAYAFMLTDKVKNWWIRFLRSSVPKTAHDIKFEEKWSRAKLNTHVNNWAWCTQNAAHTLDNRGHISGLKFQTYVNFGVPDYSSEVSKLLEAPNSLALNEIHKIPKEKLLTYGAYDAYFTKRLLEKQLKQYEIRDRSGADFLTEVAQALMDDEENGLVVNIGYLKKQKKICNNKIVQIKKKINDSDIGKLWKKEFPKINHNSSQQLSYILYDVLKLPVYSKTSKGNNSVDEKTLLQLENSAPIVNDLIRMRKLEKTIDTYIDNWIIEAGQDHILRCFYHLNIARTFRTSSSSPNMQNIPIRDEEQAKSLRKALYAHIEHILVEIDYKQIEVAMSCCVHKDPVMINYVKDKTTDMHRDMSMECYLLAEEQVSSPIRKGTKNAFVFPEFYGSYWKNTGADLWKNAQKYKTQQGIPLINHLKKKGIGTEERFLFHIKKVEKRFWNERFKVYSQWKEDIWKDYLENGYVDLLTGLRCSGPMDQKAVTNYPIQGPAAHCLLKSKINTKKWIVENDKNILPVGQIHDSGLFSIPEKDLDNFAKAVKKIWCEDIVKEWPWIIVPLDVEIEVTPVNGSWADKKKYEL